MLDRILCWFNSPDSFLVLATFLLVIVTFIYAIYTKKMSTTMAEESRKTANSRLHELLWRLLERYGSAEMLLAIDSLYRFRDDCKKKDKNLVEEYEKMRKKDFDIIENLPYSAHTSFVAGTLHYRRRIVKNFYQFLAALHELEPNSDPLIYTHWPERNLRIIHEILIPIEENLAIKLGTYSSDFEVEIGRLRKLYADSNTRLPSPKID